jgi:hypothetical protein
MKLYSRTFLSLHKIQENINEAIHYLMSGPANRKKYHSGKFVIKIHVVK